MEASIITSAIQAIINPILKLLVAAGVVYFMWGLFVFMMHRDDPKEQETAKTQMIWGVVGVAVMMSAFGIINFIIGSLKYIKG